MVKFGRRPERARLPGASPKSCSAVVWAYVLRRLPPPQSIMVWDAAPGEQLWTTTGNDTNGPAFLIMQFPDGLVRLSDGAEPLVRLVRGFEVRPFDDTVKRAFIHP